MSINTPSFVELLRLQCAQRAQHPAIVTRDRTVTYAQLDRAAQEVAAFLHAQGVRKGDRVILSTAEKLPFTIAHLGIMLSGGVSLPLHTQFAADEFVYFCRDSGARFAIAAPSIASVLTSIRSACPSLEGIVTHDDILRGGTGGSFHDAQIGSDDPCFMLYSSGTTGHPKGMVYTHRAEAEGLAALARCWQMTPDDRLLNVLPLHHLHGLSFALHLSLVTGGTVMLDDASSVTERLRDATVFMAIPTMYYALLRRSEFREEAHRWHRMRLFTCGSAPVRAEVLPDIEAIIGQRLINRYGMTEAHVITSIPLDGPWPWGSVGVPLDGMDVRVVHDDETVIPVGSCTADGSPVAGEVRIRSSYLFSAYWRKPDTTTAALDGDGFFRTGDIGYRTADGFLTLLGRKDDLIIVDGENVHPATVERVLDAYVGVQESAVIGCPDVRRGERVVAVVVADDSFDLPALYRHCAERLASNARPAHIDIVRSLPRNAMGKVLKRVLRERYAHAVV